MCETWFIHWDHVQTVESENKSETPQLYNVPYLLENNYNRWDGCQDNSNFWCPPFTEGKYLVLDWMIEDDKLFQKYEYVLVENSND